MDKLLQTTTVFLLELNNEPWIFTVAISWLSANSFQDLSQKMSSKAHKANFKLNGFFKKKCKAISRLIDCQQLN